MRAQVSLPAVAMAFAALPACVARVVIGCSAAAEVEANIAHMEQSAMVRLTPLKNGGDHSFGGRFGPLRNRPPVFWRHFLDSWRQDGENSEKMEKKASKMGEIQPSN